MNRQVLVLNQNYEPLNITSMRRAVVLLHLGKAEVVAELERHLRSTNHSMHEPTVVRLSHFVRRPYPDLRVTRRGIFARDGHRCQYCGAENVVLTIDHVLPSSRGGGNDWTNLVASCVACNNKKGSRTPEEAGMRLRHTPFRPRTAPCIGYARFVVGVRDPYWNSYLAPYAKGLELN
ncbi:MAG: HNH endonuclease [Armatimonadetes bacterium]|nr:HNH endonuclease [Armatimonadota bacterium]